MTRTPDEIKKGLDFCSRSTCGDKDIECPYECGNSTCITHLTSDALALIQQLQAENAEKDEKIRVLESRNNALYHTILGVMHFVDKWLDVPAYDPDEDINGTTAIGRASQAREITLQAIEQLEAERDAAVENIRGDCVYCLHLCEDMVAPSCFDCANKGYYRWEWRGVQKEDSDDGKE